MVKLKIFSFFLLHYNMLSYSTIVAVYGILIILFTLITMMCKYKIYDLSTLPPGATPKSFFGVPHPLTPVALEAKITFYRELAYVFSILACFFFIVCVIFMALSSMKEGSKYPQQYQQPAQRPPMMQRQPMAQPQSMSQPQSMPQTVNLNIPQQSTTSEYTM
jgi:hypothetical protein